MLHATFQIIIFVIAATFHPLHNVKRTETNKAKDMKLRLKIFTLISVLTLFFCTPGAMARHGKALEVAREIKEQTDRSVDSLQSTIGSLNTDSLGEKVIYEAPADKDTDDDNDDSVQRSIAHPDNRHYLRDGYPGGHTCVDSFLHLSVKPTESARQERRHTPCG